MSRVYLDYNASAPLRPEARAAMLEAMEVTGNPSSVHQEGRAAKAIVEAARAQVAAAVGAKPVEVIFTSGATEAARVLDAGGEVIVDPAAHDALWSHMGGARMPGAVSTYAMGVASGETGIVAELPRRDAEGWHRPGGMSGALLLDATQALGRLPFSFHWSGAEMAILSAHKIGGPKGVGALILRDGIEIESLAPGGGQEMGRRSGTENVAGIAGFGAAAAAAMRDLEAGTWDRVAAMRDTLEAAIEAAESETIFVGKDGPRLPNTSLMLTPGWKGETQVMAMDLAGFAVSSGSACSSGKVRASRVLRAMGYDEAEAACALRVSLGPDTTEDEVLRFAEAWTEKRARQRTRAA